jgi:hypothetical protein
MPNVPRMSHFRKADFVSVFGFGTYFKEVSEINSQSFILTTAPVPDKEGIWEQSRQCPL